MELESAQAYAAAYAEEYGVEQKVVTRIFDRADIAAHFMHLFYIIGKEKTTCVAKFRDRDYYERHGIRDFLRALKNRKKLCKQTNRVHDYTARELLCFEKESALFMPAAVIDHDDVDAWNDALEQIIIQNADKQHFRLTMMIRCQYENNVLTNYKYFILALPCAARTGAIVRGVMNELHHVGFERYDNVFPRQ